MKVEVTAGDLRALRIETAARLIERSPEWLYQRVRSGEVPVIKLGDGLRIRRDDLDAWLKQQSVVGE